MRPIDADVLVKKLKALEWETLFNTYGTAIREINDMPTLDMRPNIHAHWIIKPIAEEQSDSGVDAECSNCGHILWDWEDERIVKFENHFCPYCGAGMNEEENNG